MSERTTSTATATPPPLPPRPSSLIRANAAASKSGGSEDSCAAPPHTRPPSSERRGSSDAINMDNATSSNSPRFAMAGSRQPSPALGSVAVNGTAAHPSLDTESPSPAGSTAAAASMAFGAGAALAAASSAASMLGSGGAAGIARESTAASSSSSSSSAIFTPSSLHGGAKRHSHSLPYSLDRGASAASAASASSAPAIAMPAQPHPPASKPMGVFDPSAKSDPRQTMQNGGSSGSGRNLLGGGGSGGGFGSFTLRRGWSLRERIKQQLSSFRQTKQSRDKEGNIREWSNCLAKWHLYQPSAAGSAGIGGVASGSSSSSGIGGSGGGSGSSSQAQLSARELAANQKKMINMLLASGIPSHLRPSVWLLIIGNGLGLTPQLFEQLRTQCAQRRVQYEEWRLRTNSKKHAHDSSTTVNNTNSSNGINDSSSVGHGDQPHLAKLSVSPAEPASVITNTGASHTVDTDAPAPTLASAVTTPSVAASDAASSPAAPALAVPSSGGVQAKAGDVDEEDVSLDPSCAAFPLIDQDLPRTFPELAFFHAEGPYQQPLRVVLECVAAYRAERERVREQERRARAEQSPAFPLGALAPLFPNNSAPSSSFSSSSSSSSSSGGGGANGSSSCGYVQGLSFLAAILLLALGDDEFLTFVALANLLENAAEPLGRQLFSMQSIAKVGEDWMQRFDAQLALSLPTLHAHFVSGPHAIGLRPSMYLWKMVLCTYAQTLPLDAVFRTWDVFLYESFRNRADNPASSAAALASPKAMEAYRASMQQQRQQQGGGSSSPASVTSGSDVNASSPSLPSFPSQAGIAPTSSSSSGGVGGGGSGFPFLFRVALGILSLYSEVLCQMSFEECMHFLTHLPGKNAGSAASSSSSSSALSSSSSSSSSSTPGSSSSKTEPGSTSAALGAGTLLDDESFDIDLLFQHIRAIKMLPAIWNTR